MRHERQTLSESSKRSGAGGGEEKEERESPCATSVTRE